MDCILLSSSDYGDRNENDGYFPSEDILEWESDHTENRELRVVKYKLLILISIRKKGKVTLSGISQFLL